ncbi:hypothetical protein MKZ20_21985 [Psychrobacillus sp. FSL K6-2684]|uniref:DUF1281 family ferredoxin-like fold protein n=1 Tax=unclassified Psychrobacillus TaxID=2636677 RepID=UPI0030FAAEA5
MANRCNNKLLVSGEYTEDFLKACETLDESGIALSFSLNGLVPVSEQVKKEEEWGVVGDVADVIISISGHEKIIIEFTTPWREPHVWFKKVADMYPTLTLILSFYEPGHEFAGLLKSERGYYSDESYNNLVEYEQFVLGDSLHYFIEEAGLGFSLQKMKNLYLVDKYIEKVVNDLIKRGFSEEKALEIAFNSYILDDYDLRDSYLAM